MMALGVWGEDSYLANNWNRIDFVIVVASVMDATMEIVGALGVLSIDVDFGGLRALRCNCSQALLPANSGWVLQRLPSNAAVACY